MMTTDRSVSRNVVALLIHIGSYEDAGEVGSGCEDAFAAYSRLIKETSEKARELPAGVPCLELRRVLETARQEINGYDRWRDDVLATLPAADEQSGETGPLRQAFVPASRVRDSLSQEVAAANESYSPFRRV